MKCVGTVRREDLVREGMVRLPYPPFDVLVALVDDVPFAIEDACNHAGASLAEGELEGARIMCPMHGYVFDMRSGELVAPKGLCDAQRTFRVTAEGDVFTVWDDFALRIV